MRGSYEIDMVNGPLLGKIVRFAIPLAISGMLQLLFNAADIVVVGRFAGSSALAAVGSTGAMINLIVNLFIGLSVGTNVLAAQYYGGGKGKELSETVHTSILTSLLAGTVLLVIGVSFAEPLLQAMGTPPEVLGQAALYMRIFFLGMPAAMLYNFGAAILRAVGDTRRPLYYLLLAGVVNVVLNLFFVIVLHMGVAGVAVATILSQAISAGLVFWCLTKVEGPYRLVPKQLRINKDKLIGMAKIGLPAGIQGASFAISNVLIQSSINSFGAVAMAGNAAAANIEGFVSTGMDAFCQAALSFTGQNMGAKKHKRVSRVLVLCLAMVAATGLFLGVGAYLLAAPLLSVYSTDPQVVEFGIRRMEVVAVLQCVGGVMSVLVGVLRGMGASFVPMVITISSVCGFRIVWILTAFAAFPTMTVLYLSYPITWALAALLEALCLVWILKKRQKHPLVQS